MLFLNGAMVPATKNLLENLSPGILSGCGVFETMRAYDGKIFALNAHLKRLFAGLVSLNIKTNFSSDTLEKQLYLSLTKNELKNARIRLTVWQSQKKVKISIIAFPYLSYSLGKYLSGFKGRTFHPQVPGMFQRPRIKSVNYLGFLLAFRRAKIKGCDEAILLDKKGCVVEGSRSNIFCVKDNVLYTPNLESGCLNGITRQILLKIAASKGITCKESAVLKEELFLCDEAFLTNSLMEIMPLTNVDGQPIGSGRAGKITLRLLAAYRLYVKKSL